MIPKDNLIGEKFGKLLVVSFSHYNSKYRYNYWNCICECGKNTTQPTASLRRKKHPTESCGCYRKERASLLKPWRTTHQEGDATSWSLFLTYKRSEKDRGIKFNIGYEDFKKLTSKPCYYCRIKPFAIHKKQNTNGDYVYNGLDRIDSDENYELDNVVPCCKNCNYAKRLMSSFEFSDWVRRVYKIFELKGEYDYIKGFAEDGLFESNENYVDNEAESVKVNSSNMEEV